jgi:AP-3 complex subunit beta
MTKSFVNEADITKMEIITFSSKLITTAHPQLPVLAKFAQHVLNLAKYDRSYDIRDKARLVRVLLASKLRESSARLLHTKKPQQVETSVSKDRSR